MTAATGDIEIYRRELTGYCYRMLGSAFEADDAVQETMLRAWKAAGGFEGRSSLRSWLYRIATNVCLDALRGEKRRALPMDLGPSSPPVESQLRPQPAEDGHRPRQQHQGRRGHPEREQRQRRQVGDDRPGGDRREAPQGHRHQAGGQRSAFHPASVL